MKRKLVVFWAIILILALPLSAFSDSTFVAIPKPPPCFYVLDKADVLTDVTELSIVKASNELYEAYGAQIVFVTVKTTGETDISNYAHQLFNDWGIGDKDRNNGVLVLLAIEDDDYWLTRGKGIEKNLPSVLLRSISNRYLEPYFAKKEYDTGCDVCFNAILSRMWSICFKKYDPYKKPKATEETKWTEVSSGIYTVGEHIPEGDYTVKTENNGLNIVNVYAKEGDESPIQMYVLGQGRSKIGRMPLKQGNIVDIWGTVFFSDYQTIGFG